MTGFLLTAKQKLMLCINKRLYRAHRRYRTHRAHRRYGTHRAHRRYGTHRADGYLHLLVPFSR